MGLAVSVICRNANDDRVIPRFSRYLRNCLLGWTLAAAPDPDADVIYLSGYFEEPFLRPWPDKPVAAYFTHREVEPPGNGKAKLYDRMARKVALRIATCALYAEPLADVGPTAQIAPPVERGRFTIPKRRNSKLVAGFSGYTYSNKRKGEDLARLVVSSKGGQRAEWRASGGDDEMPILDSRETWPLVTQEERMKKGKLVRVEIRPGQFVKMYEADAIARGLIAAPEPKARPKAEDKMRLPGRDKTPEPVVEPELPEAERPDEAVDYMLDADGIASENDATADDLTAITGVGPATARVLAANGITTFEALREAGRLDYLTEAVNDAIEEWRASG